MAGRRALAFKALIAEYREMGIKKADAIAFFAVSDTVPSYVRVKAKRMLAKIEKKEIEL